MLLFRLLLLSAMAFIAWRIYRLLLAPRAVRDQPAAKLRSEDMVECSHCALRIPRSRALPLNDRWYCCEEHRQASDDRPASQ